MRDLIRDAHAGTQATHPTLPNLLAAGSSRAQQRDPVVIPAPRVLLVEDDETLALVIAYNLRAAGYNVEWISRGDLVEAYLAFNAVDIVILDWILPGRSGLDLCRWLRRHALRDEIPIIMATALGHEDDRAAGLTAGADDYIAKPFSMAALIERVGLLLQGRSSANA